MSTSQAVGTFLPFLSIDISSIASGFIAFFGSLTTEYYGWRTTMFIPGISAVIFGFLLVPFLRDSPEALGLPPIDADEKVDLINFFM